MEVQKIIYLKISTMEKDIHIEEEARNGFVKNLEEKIPNNIRLIGEEEHNHRT